MLYEPIKHMLVKLRVLKGMKLLHLARITNIIENRGNERCSLTTFNMVVQLLRTYMLQHITNFPNLTHPIIGRHILFTRRRIRIIIHSMYLRSKHLRLQYRSILINKSPPSCAVSLTLYPSLPSPIFLLDIYSLDEFSSAFTCGLPPIAPPASPCCCIPINNC